MQNLPRNFEDLSANEKIKFVIPQENPLKDGSLILIGEHKRSYLMEIIPQKKNTFEGNLTQKVTVKCIARNMDEAFEGITALLTETFRVYETESQKKRECGWWYEGNKYFLNLLESDNFKKVDLDSEITLDAQPTIDRINQLIKEERKQAREESKRRKEERKEFERKNPAQIIKFIPSDSNNSAIINTIDELKVEFNEIPKQNSIKNVVADYEKNSFFELNLIDQTCGCDSFQKNRHIYPVNDVRRLCQHLRYELLQKHCAYISELAECYISYRSRDNFNISKYQLSSGVPFYIGHNGTKSEWIDIFARKRRKGEKEGNFTGAYERYGYNLLEKRWSYGEGPAGAKEIKIQIAKQFPTTLNPKSKSGQEVEGCYIATAVYGCYDAPEVLSLRRFRDQKLKKHILGRFFISLYYLVSPSLANKLSGMQRTNSFVRKVLDKFIRLIG